MKRNKILAVFLGVLIFLTLVELVYFVWLRKSSKTSYKPTAQDLAEIKRSKQLAQKGEADYNDRQVVLAAEATKTADLKPFSQNQNCYVFSQDQVEQGVASKKEKDGLITIESEGRLQSVEEITTNNCQFFKLGFVYSEPFFLNLAKDLFLETENGKVNAGFLKQYLGRRVRLGLEYEKQGQDFVIKNWLFIRFYVE